MRKVESNDAKAGYRAVLTHTGQVDIVCTCDGQPFASLRFPLGLAEEALMLMLAAVKELFPGRPQDQGFN